MLSLKELQYFSEVAHCLTLSRAAERLGISQPSLSIGIKRIEHAIGVPLFNRSKKGVTLTPAGKQLLKHVQQLMQLWEEVKAKAYDAEHDIAGRLTLGCHPSVALHHLPHRLPSFLNQNQNLELKIEHDLSRNITEAVINMKLDVGIVVNPVKHPDLIIIKLREDKVTFWHNFSNDELQMDSLTLLYDSSLLQSTILLNKIKKQPLEFKRFIDSSNLELIAKLATKKVGVVILPTSIAKNESQEQLHPLNQAPHFVDEICIVYRNENRFVKSIDALIKCLKENV
jgi:LysR family transcriptional regulator, cell division regulator